MTLKDRIRDYITDHKETIIKVLVVAGIAAIMSGIIIAGVIDGVHSRLEELDSDVDRVLELWPYPTQDDIDAIGNRTDDNEDMIGGLDSRLGSAENCITALQNDVAGLLCSPPEGYLTGTFGNYTLHARASEAGEFTVNVHLVYSPPLTAGNSTNFTAAASWFYDIIDYTSPYLRDYYCTISYDGVAWGISRVSFNIGTITLAAKAEAAIDVKCGGLPVDPSFAYVEIYPVSQ